MRPPAHCGSACIDSRTRFASQRHRVVNALPFAEFHRRLLLQRDEIDFFAHGAIRAGPAVRNLRPARACSKTFTRAALRFVIDVSAVGALVARSISSSRWLDRLVATRE